MAGEEEYADAQDSGSSDFRRFASERGLTCVRVLGGEQGLDES